MCVFGGVKEDVCVYVSVVDREGCVCAWSVSVGVGEV